MKHRKICDSAPISITFSTNATRSTQQDACASDEISDKVKNEQYLKQIKNNFAVMIALNIVMLDMGHVDEKLLCNLRAHRQIEKQQS
ncbi:hypothetical protein T09_8793 [Trichinella sp. T9]|nr:hypothetical protein T09_8793 [Trichinella sp. T9]